MDKALDDLRTYIYTVFPFSKLTLDYSDSFEAYVIRFQLFYNGEYIEYRRSLERNCFEIPYYWENECEFLKKEIRERVTEWMIALSRKN